MVLHNNIRELRFRDGEMTRKELSDQVGVSRQTINAIENNRYAPTIDVAMRIADVFSVFVEGVFQREPNPEDDVERPDVLTVTVHWDDDPDPVEPDCSD